MSSSFAFNSPKQLVTEFNRLWAFGDLTTAFSYVHDDAVYQLHLSGELVAIGGETAGKAYIEPAMRKIRDTFGYLVWRPSSIVESGEEVRVQLEFLYRHIPSGELLGGTCRFIYTVREGMIVRVEEFHDRAKFEAFLRLFTPEATPASS